jgi:cardiolipin synthase
LLPETINVDVMWPEFLFYIKEVVAVGVVLVAALIAGGHALLYRRDARTSIAWVGLVLLVPLLGSILYFTLGLNRIRRRAQAIRDPQPDRIPTPPSQSCAPEEVERCHDASHLGGLTRLVDRLVHHRLTTGNRIEVLKDGDEAIPAMVEAIEQAQRSITLTSYLFDSDRVGRRFVTALSEAKTRGVEVRVLVDGVGDRYSHPPVTRLLRRAGVPAARFLPPLAPWRFAYMNLRSHRKIMVVDGQLGFTGGINIREGNLLRLDPPASHPIRDVHARVTGPVVAHLQETFVEDWAFATEEQLRGELWFPPLERTGDVFARGIPDGPDENLDHLRLTLLGALTVARRRVRIVTPYFIPDTSLITALNVAALRGIQVDIVLPSRNNLRLVQWASTAMLWQVLERGCRIWLTPPPFDHAKLMVVDGVWCLLGSGNWDPRSLRLNFEFNIECYDRSVAAEVEGLVEERLARASRLTQADVDGRSLPVRLRDGVARLFTPYL